MPKKSASTKKKSIPTTATNWINLRQAGATLEQMQTLHLVLLLCLTVMSTLLMTKVLKQEQEIQSLRFRLEFMTDRYYSERSKVSTTMAEQDEPGEESDLPALPEKNLQF